MSRLDDYRTALLVAHPGVTNDELVAALDAQSESFSAFVVDHGLGPLWHERTGRDEFHESRMAAEALFLSQEHALREIGIALDAAEIAHVVIKGAANRLLLYQNPAIRACFDLDLLTRPEDRVKAALALAEIGYKAIPEAEGISRVLVLSRGSINIDLHWGLLREGRLRVDPAMEMLERRRRADEIWVLSGNDTLFTLLVHPAFAKHLAGWNMGLHRVVDLLEWVRLCDFDWSAVRRMLADKGVGTAAWATLRWTQLLAGKFAPASMEEMLRDLRPGSTRAKWIDYWLRQNLPERTEARRWFRLLGFSAFLHDTLFDAVRAGAGRRRAQRRSRADLEAFKDLLGE